MPVKDTAKYLRICLDSILEQSFDNWELLAVDDGSSDDCLSILQEYADRNKRIKAISNSQPGLLNALRLGYSHSSGELIHRMDSDDVMPADKLEVMLTSRASVNTRASVKNKSGVLITGATEYFSDEGPIGDGFRRYDKWLMDVAKNESYREEVYKECVIPSNCWLVHRDDFDRIGAFNPATFPEDYDLCFRFIEGGLKIVGLTQVLHHWRDRPDRISRNWVVYKDNRFFELKISYFFKMDRDNSRPLVLWGAGKNGKDLAKLILQKEEEIHWICDNEKKIGKNIYGITLEHYSSLSKIKNAQVVIAVASPDGQNEIIAELIRNRMKKGIDYWFFA